MHNCVGQKCRLKGLWWHSGKPHTTLGKKRPDAKIRMTDQGNPVWKGDNVGYTGLHAWIKRRLPKPDLCQECNKIPPYDLANKGVYNRELSNWCYLCRRCHMLIDNRTSNLKQYNDIRRKSGE